MPLDKPLINTSNPYKREGVSTSNITRTIYYGEVISIDDEYDGGRIKVRVIGLDNLIDNSNLSWCYPLIPKFFHIYPQVGEIVRIIIEDTKYPERARYWVGSVISQPQKIAFDSYYSALSTTQMAVTLPDAAPYTYPDSDGVFPKKDDIALIGRVNTDIILSKNQVHIRAGKHENDNILKLNVKNPAEISMYYEQSTTTKFFESNTIIMSDKIALISHDGIPKYKSTNINIDDRDNIFKTGHPIARGDVLVEMLKVMRNAIISHVHGYSNQSADKSSIIADLENLNLENLLQKNIVTN